MRIESRRQLIILHTLFINESAMTSETLAERTHASVRTIQSEIDELNKSLSSEGIARIISTQSKGHELEEIDPQRFAELRDQVLNNYAFFRDVDIESMRRKIFIAQRLLMGSSVKADELADELCLSRTAIRDDLSWVITFFASYHIEVKSRAHYGFYCEGGEFERRQLMIELLCSQYHELIGIENAAGFEALFYDDKQYYSSLRSAVLKYIRESKMSIGDLEAKKLCTYLCLMQKRIQSGHQINENLQIGALCEDSYEFGLSEKICSQPCMYIAIPPNEVQVFSYLLMCLRDYDLSSQNEISTVSPGLIKAVTDGAEYILDIVRNNFGGILLDTELFDSNRKVFISALMPIYLRSLYDTNQHRHFVTYYRYKNNDYSPVAIEVTRQMQRAAEFIFRDRIDALAFQQITELNDLLISRIPFRYKKRRIALVDDTGKANARILKEMLAEQFGKFIEYIHIFEQYELRRVDFDDYDCFMINEIENQYVYPMDFVEYDPLSLRFSPDDIFASVFAKGYSTAILNDMAAMTYIQKDVSCDTYERLLQLVAYKYSAAGDEELHRYLLEGDRLHSYYDPLSETAFLFLPYSQIERELIDIWFMKKKVNCGDGKGMRAAIIVCLKNDRSIHDICTINEMFRRIVGNRSLLERTADDVTGVYREVFNTFVTRRR